MTETRPVILALGTPAIMRTSPLCVSDSPATACPGRFGNELHKMVQSIHDNMITGAAALPALRATIWCGSTAPRRASHAHFSSLQLLEA